MVKSTAVKAVSLVCICSMLCACNASPAVSSEPSVSSQTSSVSSDAQTAEAAASTSDGTTAPLPGTDEAEQPEYNFIPVLTEDDIEYMGIPYKDLTAEQFIQLWAQCTRECNVQRLYVIMYDNNHYTDKLTGEPLENTELISEKFLRENSQQLLAWASRGFMPYRYSDVELVEIDEAPEGYYDNNNGEELYYSIHYKDIGYYYDYGKNGGNTDDRWITLKKINGYWKIGVMMSTSPPFLPVS